MVPIVTMKVAILAMLLLSLAQDVRPQSLSLRRQEEAGNDINVHGSAITVGLTNKKEPHLLPSSVAIQKVNITKSNGYYSYYPQMASNRQLQDDYSVWVDAATFPLANATSHALSGDGTVLAASDFGDFRDIGKIRNGSVRFFRMEQGWVGGSYSWNEWTNLTLFGNSTGDDFGTEISLSKDGNRVAIGARRSGSVAVYEMVNESYWALMGVILVDARFSWSSHTISLSKDGSRVAIGDWYNGRYPGNGRVYEWDGSSFLKLGGDIDGELSAEQSGSDIALSEDGMVVAIGTPTFIRVFEWSGGSWTKRGINLVGGTGGASWSWGSVALSGDGNMLAFSLRNGVQVFEWKDTEWVQVGQTLSKDVFGFGFSVSLSSSGSMLAVGSSGVYTLADSETWVELGGDFFKLDYVTKFSISSDGSTVAVGSLGPSGFVSVYNFNETSNATTLTSRPTPSTSSGPPSGPPSGPSIGPTSGPTSGCSGNFHWEFVLSSVIFLPGLLLSVSL